MGQVNYSAAKAGDIGFVKALAQENANKGITVNAICPGYIGTEMVQAIDPEMLRTKIIPLIPVGRLGPTGGDRAGGGVPGLRGGRLHHRIDAVHQRRTIHDVRPGSAGGDHWSSLSRISCELFMEERT